MQIQVTGINSRVDVIFSLLMTFPANRKMSNVNDGKNEHHKSIDKTFRGKKTGSVCDANLTRMFHEARPPPTRRSSNNSLATRHRSSVGWRFVGCPESLRNGQRINNRPYRACVCQGTGSGDDLSDFLTLAIRFKLSKEKLSREWIPYDGQVLAFRPASNICQ